MFLWKRKGIPRYPSSACNANSNSNAPTEHITRPTLYNLTTEDRKDVVAPHLSHLKGIVFKIDAFIFFQAHRRRRVPPPHFVTSSLGVCESSIQGQRQCRGFYQCVCGNDNIELLSSYRVHHAIHRPKLD